MTDLRHLGRREGPRRVDELLEQFDLVDAADRPLATYSGGMRRRLDLAMTLVGDPELIFLDEPTAGLDPRSRRMMWDTIRSLVGGGVTIFLTTQYLDEADELADRIALLDEGRIVAEGTAAELKRLVPGGHVRLEFTDQHSLAAVVPRFDDVAMDDTGLALHIPSDGSIRSLREIISNVDDSTVSAVSIHTSDLDDVFLALTGSRTTSEEEVSQ
jgi:ABC-2 type transport system ATP-binding protein